MAERDAEPDRVFTCERCGWGEETSDGDAVRDACPDCGGSVMVGEVVRARTEALL
jgi:predicted RNA-binding Zn-ribbon protein involved in translation (DUF1610 family)